MFDPSQITLGQLSSTARDWAIVGLIISFVWKARGWFAKAEQLYESTEKFIERVSTHMTLMETFANRALNNHLAHMQHDLRVLSGRKADVIEVDDSVGTPDMPGSDEPKVL
jgi:hypothetical protein